MIIAIFRRSVTGQLILNEYFWAVGAKGLWGMKNNLYFMPYPLFDPGNHHLNIRYISKNVHIYSFSIIYFSLSMFDFVENYTLFKYVAIGPL